MNGDCIEGTQSRQGGAELIMTDRNVQSEMAVISILKFQAKKILMAYGTGYHTGEWAEDFEYNIAQDVDAEIAGKLYFNVEGLTFDVRHFLGNSTVPHGRATPIMKEMSWALMQDALDAGPKVDVLVRSHVHNHIYIEQPGRTMFTTPALQLSRGRFGSRQCTGETHWGAIRLTVDNGKIVGKDAICKILRGNKPKIIKIK